MFAMVKAWKAKAAKQSRVPSRLCFGVIIITITGFMCRSGIIVMSGTVVSIKWSDIIITSLLLG